jgi:hypothetical protein
MKATIKIDEQVFIVNFHYSASNGRWIADYDSDKGSGRIWIANSINYTIEHLTNLFRR